MKYDKQQKSKLKLTNMETIFFIFTCVKDGRQYINNLFDSLLSQTTINFIHYIYEDGSSEPLGEIVGLYKEKVSKLKTPYEVIYEKNDVNVGLNRATQHCISKCTCPYFIWIDCDNWIDKDFFKHLGLLAKNNPNSDILRTLLYSYPLLESRGIVSNKWKKELQLFLRSKYYYSFFAIKNSFYKKINPNNYFLNDKSFFNDDQVLLMSLCNKAKMSYTKKAVGYFLVRNDQESAGGIPIEAGREQHLAFLNNISLDKYLFIKAYYELKDETRQVDSLIINSPKDAYKRYRLLLKKCRSEKLPYSVLHYRSRLRIYLSIIAHMFIKKKRK